MKQLKSNTQPWTPERYATLRNRLLESQRLLDAAEALPEGVPGPCLIFRANCKDGAKAAIVPLMPGLVVGRGAEDDLSFAEDGDMSENHFQIVRGRAGHWFALDMDSTNGLWINDARVSEKCLRHGDKIHAGHHDFVFHGGETGE